MLPVFSSVGLRARASLCAILLCVGSVNAAPWIGPDDVRLRHHIHVLADAALIRVPVNTWPLMWSGVISEVRRAKSQPMTAMQRRAIVYIENAFERQSKSSVSLGYSYAEQFNPIRGFGDNYRDEVQGHLAGEYIGERWAGKLQVNSIGDPLDGEHTQYDGSYLSGLWGNWAFTLGAVDRWWGPAWESGLILSNNARPVPALSVQRNSSDPFKWSWLRWMGPWQFTTFLGKLESERVIANAKLVGARFSFRPFRWMELGASRTAQWGGRGRPQDFSSFKNLALGRDNRGSSGVALSNEPGNQLGGFDWRFSVDARIRIGIYGEMIGEDEAGYQPSKRVVVMGVDALVPLNDTAELRLAFEMADTATRRFDKGDSEYNVAYEHGVYVDGYRYRARSLGASMDNDSRAHHLRALWYRGHHSLGVRLSQFDLNSDGVGIGFIDGNSASIGASNGYAANMVYGYHVASWSAQLGYYHYDGGLKLRGVDSGDDSFEFGVTYIW